MNQLHLFNGADYKPQRDNERLLKQHDVIKNLMLDGNWRSLKRIAKTTGFPEASISAQLRHLRKPKFGGYTLNRRYVGEGLYEYQLINNKIRL